MLENFSYLYVYKNKIGKIENSNYRPILFLSCMSKILEKIMYRSIYKYCVSHELLNSKKSECKRNDPTTKQLHAITHHI
jgi:hypothetical protein